MLQAVIAFTRWEERFVQHPQQIWALDLMTLTCQRSLLIGQLPRLLKKKADQIIIILQTVSVMQSTYFCIYLSLLLILIYKSF